MTKTVRVKTVMINKEFYHPSLRVLLHTGQIFKIDTSESFWIKRLKDKDIEIVVDKPVNKKNKNVENKDSNGDVDYANF
jgi:hypothetical protein